MESICCGTPTQSGRMAAQKKDFVMGLKTKFAGLMASVVLIGTLSTRAVAKSPDSPDPKPQTEFAANFGDVSTDGAGGKDDPNPKKTTDGDKIKIDGYDMRGTGKDIKKIQDGAIALSIQGDMVIFAYLDPRGKDDAIIKAQNDLFLKEIKEAITKNIKAGRKDIKLILADAQPGTRSRLIGVAKGHIGNQVNYDDTKDLDVYIRRGYDEYGYKIHPITNASTSATTPASYNVNDIAAVTNE